jgi:cytochrome c5
MSRTLLALFFLGFGLNACGDDDPPLCEDTAAVEGSPTRAACDSSTLTYENFGREFMETYCTSCHSSTLNGEEARSCAPDDHDFDTLDEIISYREHIDEIAAAGPDSVNEGMPPSGPKPTEQERLDLGVWLACEEERMP